ncbi:MAG: N-acetylmuramoyl-L-alanine amidase [Bacteroidales bacterium]|nr:N-acetylmuramoyl-L-alanine amidase [Bacteroidales bacterium]
MAAKSPIRNNRGISQDPFWVLWRTASPAVLIEVGFMSNPGDLEKLRTESGREDIAKCIVNAFKSFKKVYDSSSSISGVPKN